MKSEASRSTLQYIRLRQNLKVVDYVVFQDEQVYLSKVWILICTSSLKGLMSTRLVQISTHGNTVFLRALVLLTRASTGVVSTSSYRLSYLRFTSSQIARTSPFCLLYHSSRSASAAACRLYASICAAVSAAACLSASIAPHLRQCEPPPWQPASLR